MRELGITYTQKEREAIAERRANKELADKVAELIREGKLDEAREAVTK